MEADRVKTILRRNRVVSDPSRRENDAEHMYHFALMATVLAEYANAPVDLLRVSADDPHPRSRGNRRGRHVHL